MYVCMYVCAIAWVQSRGCNHMGAITWVQFCGCNHMDAIALGAVACGCNCVGAVAWVQFLVGAITRQPLLHGIIHGISQIIYVFNVGQNNISFQRLKW